MKDVVIYDLFAFCRIMKSAKARRIMTNSSVSQNTTDTSRTDVKQAITLMWISVLYVVCQSPKIVPDFYEALYCEYSSVRIKNYPYLMLLVLMEVTIYKTYISDLINHPFCRTLLVFLRQPLRS